MSQDSQVPKPASEQLSALSVRVLVKTVVKSVIWFGLAWIITVLVPGVVWPWYVAWTLIVIGLTFSLVSLALAFLNRRQELEATRE
jgi:hypothetical protein